ncbi:MAG: RHS repeat protein [Flavobacteriales bacterium]|nr:RHS repeat protein [Flavobacteriales bacterium]
MFIGCVKAKIEFNYTSTTCTACHWLHIWNETDYLAQAYWTVYPAAIGNPCLNAVYDAYSAVVPGLDPNIPGTFESACVSLPGMGLVSLAELINECQQMNFGTNTTWTSTEIAAYNAQQTDHMTDCSAACTTATRLAEYEAEIVAAYPGISPADLTCLRNAMQASCLQTCSNAYPTVTAAPVALPNTDLDNAGMIEFGHPQLTAGACSGGGYNMTGCSQAACLTWVGEVEPAGAPDSTFALTCEEIQATAMLQELLVQRSLQLQEQLDQFTSNYLTECAVPDNIEDNLHVEFLSGKHHYTLYYYDRAGSLMSTVPPNDEPLQLDNVSAPTPPANWPTTDIIYPERTLYRYNSLGQLVMQKTPDGGQTLMAYDRLGRLRFSQNAKQFAVTPTPAYSYTKYDGLGRVVEVGESTVGNAGNDLFDDLVYQLLKAQDPNFPTSGTHRTLTTYTDALSGLTFSNGQGQRYLVNRVSWSMSDQDGNTATTFDQVVTAYSYDPHGNVDWLVHQLPDVGQRFISYDYDLVSGHVRQLRYNEGFVDQFFQRYSYDEDGRILNAQTSADGVVWDNDARYSYYAHGPLKRTLLGEDQVQGIDHTYTIQGWLKGINAADLTNGDDPSKDGFAGPNVKVGQDAFGMMLSYFNGDFKHIGSPFDNDLHSSTETPALWKVAVSTPSTTATSQLGAGRASWPRPRASTQRTPSTRMRAMPRWPCATATMC